MVRTYPRGVRRALDVAFAACRHFGGSITNVYTPKSHEKVTKEL